MSNKLYDILKNISWFMPPVITFIGLIMKTWNIPYVEEVVISLSGLETMVCAIVKIANAKYNKKSK
jgi:hypothetical protein